MFFGSRQAGKARGSEPRYALVRFQPAHPVLIGGVSVAANTEECHSFNTGSNPVLRSKFSGLSGVAGARAGLKSRRIQFDSGGSHHEVSGCRKEEIRVIWDHEVAGSNPAIPTIVFVLPESSSWPGPLIRNE